MKLIPALASVLVLLLPGALSAETFEGKVTMKMTSPDMKGGPQSMDMSIKEGYMRMDFGSSKGSGAMITDLKNRQIIMIMTQQRMYMVRSIPETTPAPATQKAPSENLQKTGVTETILGYECTKYLVTGAKGSTELWVTDQLGTFFGLSHGGGPGARPQPPQEWENALKGGNFFPMRVVTLEGGREKFRLEVTAVEKTSLPDSLFAPPEDFRKFDMGSVMGGAMPGGFPGARPSDGNN